MYQTDDTLTPAWLADEDSEELPEEAGAVPEKIDDADEAANPFGPGNPDEDEDDAEEEKDEDEEDVEEGEGDFE